MTQQFAKKLWPLALTVFTVIGDQVVKYFVVRDIALHDEAFSFFGGFLRIVHERNLGVAFSMGHDLSDKMRAVFFTVFPLLVFGVVLYYYFRTEDLTKLQRYALAGILGGGIGNIIDRVFRPGGVVDFISVKFYGLFGMDYFPTFNVADSVITVCGILLAISVFLQARKNQREES